MSLFSFALRLDQRHNASMSAVHTIMYTPTIFSMSVTSPRLVLLPREECRSRYEEERQRAGLGH